MKIGYRAAWLILHVIFGLYFRWKVYNRERVPMTGPVILAANHASFMDPPLVGTALPRGIYYLARHSLFRFPVIGPALRYLDAIPVDREAGAGGLKIILERLFSGAAIILFPEGTRSPDGNFLPARSGIGLAVIKSEAPVVPVRIFGSNRAYGRPHLLPRPRKVIVKFGKPMGFSALREEAKTAPKPRLKEIYQEVADQIMGEIARLEAEPD
jgi:1-acyl-sn-glycerol-3-phosphate acyltransferase